jgi:ubiquinone/menaquinone biosynthesis C-methylase UbiE
MGHKFDISQKEKLDNDKRRSVLPPREILENIGLKENDTIADIGSGTGYFAIPASEIVGKAGKVYAMDISIDMIDELEKKIETCEISNIITLVTEENDFKLENDMVDFTFICSVAHEAEDITLFIKEAIRITKPKGKIVIIDWKKEESDYGPPVDHRMAPEEIIIAFKKNNIKDIELETIGEHFYTIKAKYN